MQPLQKKKKEEEICECKYEGIKERKKDPPLLAGMTWAGAQLGLQILGCRDTQQFDSAFLATFLSLIFFYPD